MTHGIDLFLFCVHIRKEIKINCEDKQETLDETHARIHTRETHQWLCIVLYCVHVHGRSHYPGGLIKIALSQFGLSASTICTSHWYLRENLFKIFDAGYKSVFIILIYKSQQDAHVTWFILSDNCSTCFGCHHHPSSGAQKTVTTASGNRYTVIDRVKFTYRLD